MSPEAQIIAKALSNPRRLEIITLLYESPLAAGTLTYLLEDSQPSTAQHLRILRQAGLLRRDRRGLYVIYELADTRARLFARGLTNLLR
jgi:ArsR family transcriptional regulator